MSLREDDLEHNKDQRGPEVYSEADRKAIAKDKKLQALGETADAERADKAARQAVLDERAVGFTQRLFIVGSDLILAKHRVWRNNRIEEGDPTPHSEKYTFKLVEVADLKHAGNTLIRYSNDDAGLYRCWVLGTGNAKFLDGANARHITKETVDDTPTRLLVADLDDLPGAPLELKALANYVRDRVLPEEFRKAEIVISLTASHDAWIMDKAKEKLVHQGARVRLLAWLDRPILLSEMKAWVADRIPGADLKICHPARKIYLRPSFEGVDPYPKRWLRLDGEPEVKVPLEFVTLPRETVPARDVTPANPAPDIDPEDDLPLENALALFEEDEKFKNKVADGNRSDTRIWIANRLVGAFPDRVTKALLYEVYGALPDAVGVFTEGYGGHGGGVWDERDVDRELAKAREFTKRDNGSKIGVADVSEDIPAVEGGTLPATVTYDPNAEWPASLPIPSASVSHPEGLWIDGTLPASLEAYGRNLAEVIGANAPAVLAMMVITMGAMIPAAVRFRPRVGSIYEVPATFYGGFVGRPGSKKTAIIGALMAPVRAFDKVQRRIFEELKAKHEQALRVKPKKGEPALEMPPKKPVDRRRISTTATIEGFAKRASQTKETGIMCPDELTSFFAFDKYNASGGDRPFWLSAYEGEDHHAERADETKCVSVENLRASIVGGIQPAMLGDTLSSLARDGLLHRFNWVPTGQTKMSGTIPLNDALAAIHARACELILKVSMAGMGAEIKLQADADADAISREAERRGIELSSRLHEADPFCEIATKAQGFVARYTMALHLIKWAVNEFETLAAIGWEGTPEEFPEVPLTVTGETAAQASALFWDVLLPNTRAVFAHARRAAVETDVGDLVKFIQSRPVSKTWFTATEIGRDVHRFAKDGLALKAATDELVALNWLRSEKAKGGTRWHINPDLRD